MPEPIYVSVRIPKDLYDEVSEVATDEERSISATVRRILKRYLAEREAPVSA
jgi:metal-responsive CopG/Arc/MetJ family transcriptional regulator